MKERPRLNNVTKFPKQRRPIPKQPEPTLQEIGDVKVHFGITDDDLDLDRTWLVDQLIPMGYPTSIYAKAKVGKSMALMALHHAVAHGRGYLGYPVERGCSIYLPAERPGFAKANLRAYDRHYQTETRNIGLVAEWPNLDLVNGGKAFLAQMAELIAAIEDETGQACRLVSIDTLAKAIRGSEEGVGEYSEVGALMEELAAKHKVTPIICGHTGKNDKRGLRGSSVLEFGQSAICKVHRIDNDPLRHGELEFEIGSAVGFVGRIGYLTKLIDVAEDRRGRMIQSRVMLYDDPKRSAGPPRANRTYYATVMDALISLMRNAVVRKEIHKVARGEKSHTPADEWCVAASELNRAFLDMTQDKDRQSRNAARKGMRDELERLIKEGAVVSYSSVKAGEDVLWVKAALLPPADDEENGE